MSHRPHKPAAPAHVTGFFRDPEAFETLKAKVYPEFKLAGPKDPVRIWIAACSTGEEAYSHAISLLEYFERRGLSTPIRVFATDLDEGVLAKARGGFFSGRSAASLSARRLARYFDKVEGGYRVAKAVRDLCVFARHDVAQDAPFSNLDLISGRGLPVPPEPVLRRRFLPLFHYALKPGGILMLDRSEAAAGASGGFGLVDKKAGLFSKIATDGEPAPAFAVGREGIEWPSLPERRAATGGAEKAGPDFQAEVSRILLNSYTPAGVLVDDALNVVQTHGSTSRFLELPSGVVGANLAKTAHADLSLAIRAAVRRAKSEDAPVQRRLQASLRGEAVDLQLDVIPVKTPLERRRRYLVLFSPLSQAEGGTRAGKPHPRQLEFRHLREEREMDKGRPGLDKELAAANEELLAAGEKLRTANEDLGRRNAGLLAENEELAGLLSSACAPILILDRELRVRRFTPAAEAAFALRPSDAGKAATSLDLAIPLPRLKALASKVMRSRRPLSLPVQDREGRSYDLRIRPHLARDKSSGGVSLSLVETTESRKEVLALRSSGDFANAALDAVRVSWVVVDSSLRIEAANPLFYESFRTTAAKAAGRTLLKLGKGMWHARPLQEKLHALTRDESPFTDYECEFELPALGTRSLNISGRAVARGAGAPKSLLLTLEDVTLRKQAAEAAALRKSEGRQRDFVANVSHELMTPITAIKGYSEALVAGALEVPGKRLKFTQIIEKHADRLAQLVEDLLQLSTSEAGHKKSVDSVPLAAQLKRLLLGLAPVARKKGVTIRVKVAPELKVAVNKSELNQILQNLVANAIKYNRPKGRVAIAASVVGKRIIVSIQDTGIGVPKEDLTRIFDRFHRAANARALTERGTGLGLSIAKSILVAHGCRIWAESSTGRGTTFFFTLPKG